MQAFVEALGLVGPGLPGWQASRAALAGDEPYVPVPIVVPPCELLPTAERRRASASVRLALAAAQEAFANAARDPAATPTVFATSSGDGATLHNICSALATAEREVSPTRFHNSVHNAAAGYWSICTGCQEASTSLCGHDASFAAGLLEAATQVVAARLPVALIAYDLPYPEPLHAVRPLSAEFGMALILTPAPSAKTLSSLEVSYAAGSAQITRMQDVLLESLRAGVPPARSLPLLAALARRSPERVLFDYGPGTLRVEAAPWS